MGTFSNTSPGAVNISNTSASTSTNTGALIVAGGVGIGGNLTVGGDISVSGWLVVEQAQDILSLKSGATGVVAHDVTAGTVFYHTTPSASWTSNFQNMPTTNNRTTIVSIIIVQGATPYIPNAVQIDGVSPGTIKWLSGLTPTGNANKVDIVTFSFIRTGSAWAQVLGDFATYG
jgi:hypothetical protein